MVAYCFFISGLLSAIYWTFHFERVAKGARSNVKSFCRNVITGTFLQWAWIAIHQKIKHGMNTYHDARLTRSHEQNDYHQSQSFIPNSGRALTDEEGSNRHIALAGNKGKRRPAAYKYMIKPGCQDVLQLLTAHSLHRSCRKQPRSKHEHAKDLQLKSHWWEIWCIRHITCIRHGLNIIPHNECKNIECVPVIVLLSQILVK